MFYRQLGRTIMLTRVRNWLREWDDIGNLKRELERLTLQNQLLVQQSRWLLAWDIYLTQELKRNREEAQHDPMPLVSTPKERVQAAELLSPLRVF
jgi:hypothetical protein